MTSRTHHLRLPHVCAVIAAIVATTLFGEPTLLAQTSLPAQIELARLIDLTADRLKARISYDDQALKARVTLRQADGMSDLELWQLTNRVLAEQGWTTVRSGDDGTLAVVKLANAAQSARVDTAESVQVAIAAAGSQPSGAAVRPGFQRVLVRLQRASSKDVQSVLQLVLTKQVGSVTEADQAGGGLIAVADLTPNLDIALRLIAEIDSAAGGATVREVPARNVEPSRIASLAKQLADKGKASGGRELRGDVIPAVSGTGVLIIAPPSVVPEWEKLIELADQRESVERRTYSVASFAAKDVAALIEQAVRGSGGSQAGGGGAGGVAGGSDDRWRLIQDDLTGSFLITATPTQHAQVEELLARLNSVPAESRRPVRSFRIRNRGVREIQQVLTDLMRAGVLEASASQGDLGTIGSQTSRQAFAPGGTFVPTLPGGSPRNEVPPGAAGGLSGSSTDGSSGGATGTAAGLGQGPGSGQGLVSGQGPGSGQGLNGRQNFAESVTSTRGGSGSGSRGIAGASLTLTSDEATNTLIAVGEPRLLAELEKLLPTLDVRQPQVMLEAMIVSLSDSQSVNFGIELEKLRLSGDTFIRLSSLFGLSTASGSGAAATRTVGDGAGFTGAVLNPGDFSVVVRALETLNNGRSFSQPKVLVNNNQQATFNSVLQQPFASTNASTTVATTAFGGTQDAGTTISVRPQIAEGDHLVLTYSVSLSSFVGASASANLPPPRQQNSVQSVATIPDGYTVVVGGLELATDGEGKTQIPLLGDIPLVGELFKNRNNTTSRQRFYVFLRANVLRQSGLDDLKYLSAIDAAGTDVDDGWPKVEPRVIR